MVTQDTQRFVGRKTELNGLLQMTEGLRHGVPPQRCLINLCGAHGIGKSAMLAALRRRTMGVSGLRTISLRMPPLSPGYKAPTPEARLNILRQLAAEAVVPPPAAALDEAAADAALADMATALAEDETPVLLLIEAEHRSAPIVFGWLERGLLLRLVRAERVVAVIASRSPLRWREFDTRRRAESITLTPLGPADTAAQLDAEPATGEAVISMTIGHPLANELARALVVERPDPATWDATTRAELARQIIAVLYERVGPGLNAELRCTLEVLSVVREFALPLMRALLHFCGGDDRPRSQALQLITIKQLQELDLVLWDQASLSYRVTPILRQLIAGAMRRIDPERYAAIQRAAVTYYSQVLEEVLVSRHIHLLELLWHTLDGTDPAAAPPELLRRLVRDYLGSPDGSHIDVEAVAALRALIAEDAELAAALSRHGSNLPALIAALDRL